MIMKAKIKKIMSIILTMALVLGSFAGIGGLWASPASAATPTYSPFHDVEVTYWGLPYIVKSESMGVIAGYGDGIFKPEQTVTMLEAVIMAVRAMGLEDEINNPNLDYDVSAYNLPTTWNAKGYVVVALSKGLIRANDVMRFNHSAGASRAWTAQLLVRTLGLDAELSVNAVTTFDDDSQIPNWAKPSVALAAAKGVISGMPNTTGGMDYRPNAAVKRVELATLIAKSDIYLMGVENQLPLGQVRYLDADSAVPGINLASEEDRVYSYDLHNSCLVYNASFESVGLAGLEIGDWVRYAEGDDNRIIYIEIVDISKYEGLEDGKGQDEPNPGANPDYMGLISKHRTDDKVLVIQDLSDENKLYTYSYDDKLAVYDETGKKTMAVKDLSNGIQISWQAKDNVISHIYIQTKQEEAGQIEGIIDDLDQVKKFLTLDYKGGLSSYLIDANVSIYDERSLPMSLAQLAAGDQIQIDLDNNKITKIKLIKTQSRLAGEADVVSVAAGAMIITLDSKAYGVKAYTIAKDMTVIIKGIADPVLGDIQAGDKVAYLVENDKVVKLEVISRSYDNEIMGELYSVDVAKQLITIYANEEYKSYKIGTGLIVEIANKDKAKLSDISEGSIVKLFLEKNVLQKILLENKYEGTVVAVDRNKSLITIDTAAGRENLPYDGNTSVNYYNKTSPGISDIKVGQSVIIYMEKGVIEDISVWTEIETVIKSFNRANKYIEVEIDSKSRSFYLSSDVSVSVGDYDKASLDDVYAQDKVKLTFLGYSLKAIKVSEGSYGKVESLSGNRATVALANGQKQTIVMDSSITYYDHKGSRLSYFDIGVNDYIKVVTADKTTIYRADKLSGRVLSLEEKTSMYELLYLDKDGKIVKAKYYPLAIAKDAKGSLTLKDMLVGDLIMDKDASIYTIQDRVIAIEIK